MLEPVTVGRVAWQCGSRAGSIHGVRCRTQGGMFAFASGHGNGYARFGHSRRHMRLWAGLLERS